VNTPSIAVFSTAQTRVSDCGMLNRLDREPRAPNGVRRRIRTEKEEIIMLYTIAVILLIAWLLGIVGTYTIGAFVHVLLVIAIVLFLVGLISGRRSVI
jgi:uncharacterized membrane protein (DUF485 family)